jgi:hypothetical protein
LNLGSTSIAFAETLVLEGIAALSAASAMLSDNALAETDDRVVQTEAVGQHSRFSPAR